MNYTGVLGITNFGIVKSCPLSHLKPAIEFIAKLIQISNDMIA